MLEDSGSPGTVFGGVFRQTGWGLNNPTTHTPLKDKHLPTTIVSETLSKHTLKSL